MKKAFALLLTLVMVLSMSVAAFATNSDGTSYTKGSITIKNPLDGETYTAYQILDVTYDLGSTGTTDDKYAYTISPAWVNDVVGYATPEGTTLAADWTTTTANGLTVTKNAIGGYNVTFDKDTFSAADFGEKMAAKSTGKTGKTFTTDSASGKLMVKDLDLGYYMVQPSTANTLVSLTTTDADVIVADKNEKPEVDKTIVGEEDILICEKQSTDPNAANYEEGHVHSDENNCFKEKDYTTKSVGDKVEFQLETKVPDMFGYDPYFFVMNDTMTAGLTYNKDVTVTIGGDSKTAKTLTAGTDYTVKVTGGGDADTNIRIVFNNMKQYWSDVAADNWEGEPIVIKYSAVVDEDAVMGTTGNTNNAKIEYSNNPNIKPQYDPTKPPEDPNDPKDPNYKHNIEGSGVKDPTGTSNPDVVTVYTAELDITKVDATTKNALTGAKFKIEGDTLNVSIVNKEIYKVDNTNGTYYRLKDGTYTEESPSTDGKNETTYAEESVADPVTYTELTGADAVPGVGLYYSTDGGTTKTLITATNLASVPNDAKIYQPTYNAVGLYYKDGDNYVKITEANAAEHTTGTFYKATVWKQSDLYEDTTTKYVKTEVIEEVSTPGTYTAEGFVNASGLLTFGGLSEGTYKITELIAPDGYNLLKDPVEVVIELVEGETAGSYKFQATIDGATTPISEDGGNIAFNIENNKGLELPETGGMGTYAFYIIGGLLVLGAAILLIVKKRMSV